MSEHAMVLAKMVDEGGACGKGVYLTRKQREALIVAIALLKSPVQASEARGDWALVPREPTEEMLKAARDTCIGGAVAPSNRTLAKRYRAMIAAHTQAGPGG